MSRLYFSWDFVQHISHFLLLSFAVLTFILSMNWKYFGFNFPCFFWINPLTRFPSLLSLSVFMGFYFLFFCRVVSASKLAQECICPFSSPFSSLHPMLYFLCPSSPKYWLTVMVALCVSCCCWQVCLLNRRKSKEREGGGRRLESILAGLFVMNCTTIYFPAVCLFSHNVAEFLFFIFLFQIRKLCQPRFEKGTWLPRVS